MMDYKNVNGNRIGQDDRINRMGCLFGRHLGRTRNPFYPVHPVHPVKKVLSGKAVARSRLDGVSAHPEGALAADLRYLCELLLKAETSIFKSLISRKGLTQVVDFHDIFTYFEHVFNRKPDEVPINPRAAKSALDFLR